MGKHESMTLPNLWKCILSNQLIMNYNGCNPLKKRITSPHLTHYYPSLDDDDSGKYELDRSIDPQAIDLIQWMLHKDPLCRATVAGK